MKRALVIGGTGPTGPFIVKGLYQRGYRVAILHTGRHEVPENPPELEHIHADPFAQDTLPGALGEREFELCIATYGRLRAIAEHLVGRTERFISVGGGPAYRGYMNPGLLQPPGLPVPTGEAAELVREEAEDSKGWRIARTEEAVFAAHPGATHFRYPYVYGPYQPMPREWCIVRRILDGRRQIILPDGGLALHSFGYAENLAHAVLLALDRPQPAAGQIYNCADEETPTLRQVVEIIAESLDHRFEIVSLPAEFAIPARPLVGQLENTHRLFDLTKIRSELGYRDVVPACQALARTARWLVENPPEAGGMEEVVLQDPFDYAAEDALIANWKAALAALPEVGFETEPGYTLAYSGPGSRPRSKAFE